MQDHQHKQPSIAVLKALTTEESDDHLYAKNVEEKAAEYSQYEPYLWQQYIEADPGSYDEEKAAIGLAKINLIKTSAQFASSETSRLGLDRDKWAAQFTEISSQIYKPPESSVVKLVVGEQLSNIDEEGYFGARVKSFYEALDSRLDELKVPEASFQTLSADSRNSIQAAFVGYHRDWLGVDVDEQDLFTPSDLVGLFNNLLTIRSENDKKWRGWKAMLKEGKDQVSIAAKSRLVAVGGARVDMDRQEVLGLVAHELGVHATRYVNGSSIDKSLGEGYPGYLEIEESLGVLSEWLVTGKMPHKAYDRYVDIALAMEVVPGVKMNRHELMQLALERDLSRKEADAVLIDSRAIVDAAQIAKAHVNRIFRGGDGREGEQAVFTKDAVYFPAKLEDYLARQLSAGYRPKELVEFLLQGKFDPTDEKHLSWLEDAGGDVISPPGIG